MKTFIESSEWLQRVLTLRDKCLGISALRSEILALRTDISGLHTDAVELKAETSLMRNNLESLADTNGKTAREFRAFARAAERQIAAVRKLDSITLQDKGCSGHTRETLIFLHIPKTGGTSLDSGYMQPCFSDAQRLCETDLFENDVPVRRHVFSETERISRIFRIPYWEVFRMYIDSGLIPTNLSYYAGHLCFGVHRALPTPSRYITVIRDPVDRTVSQFRLWFSLGAIQCSLRDFLRSGAHEVDNYQVRCLCVDGWVRDHCTQDMLEEARDNLARHFIYGVTEEISRLLTRIRAETGLDIPDATNEVRHLNKTVVGERVHCGQGAVFQDSSHLVCNADLTQLREMNVFDTALHAFAAKQRGS